MELSKINRRTWKAKKKCKTLEAKLQYELSTCLKNNDLAKAISLYESAVSQNLRLSHHHFNQLLHLCSNPDTLASEKSLAIEYGFRVFDEMQSNNILPTEATITQLARLAAAKDDPNYAFELVKNMKDQGLVPKLRTYDPALYCYCDKLMADEAYVLEQHMKDNGVRFEEPQMAALLRVSAETGRGERVYEYLQKLRGNVRSVSEDTAEIMERWFRSEKAGDAGIVEWDVGTVRQQREKNGGGWHGLGWLGKGHWDVKRVHVAQSGVCNGCREQLVCVDIDSGETQKFAQSVAALAMEREHKSNFSYFKEWIDKDSDYEAVVDGANIALYQQNFGQGGLSISQLESAVNELYKRNKKWPLVVLHNKRISKLKGDPCGRKLIEDWMYRRILYATPTGSNDDWYWLYAAVKLKCLVVTNDEMRDHIFELLGSSFFLQWKERHQVHYTFVNGICKLRMPPIYSIVIQDRSSTKSGYLETITCGPFTYSVLIRSYTFEESDKGSWHIPIASETSDESVRQWLCVARLSPNISTPGNAGASSIMSLHSCSRDMDKVALVTGKRKERSPSSSRIHRRS